MSFNAKCSNFLVFLRSSHQKCCIKKVLIKIFLKTPANFTKFFRASFLIDQTSHENKAKTSCMQWSIDTRILELMKLINPF